MKKKILIPLIVFFVSSLACLVVMKVPPNPEYQGRNLSSWLADLDSLQPAVTREKGRLAVRAIGTDALPMLIGKIREPETVIGALRRLSRFQDAMEITPQNVNAWRAIYAFRALGPAAAPAIPALAELLEHESTSCISMLALVAIGRDAAPSLTNALHSTSSLVRSNAAYGLARLGISV
jgi:HEAT repeat protein